MLIVGAVLALVLCVCALPALIFLGAVPFFAVGHIDQGPDVRPEVMVAKAPDKPMLVDEVAKVADQQAQAKAFAKGAADATGAIAKGKLVLKEYPPLPAPAWQGDFVKLLKERCKCDYQVVNGKLPKDQEEEIKGWNEIITRELQRRDGPTVLLDLHAEAEKTWRDRVGAKDKK
jgi:hypothetical protein